MPIGVARAHRRGKVEIELEQVLRQEIGAGVDAFEARRRPELWCFDHEMRRDGRSPLDARACGACELGGIEVRCVGQASLERKPGQEQDAPELDPIRPQHRGARSVSDASIGQIRPDLEDGSPGCLLEGSSGQPAGQRGVETQHGERVGLIDLDDLYVWTLWGLGCRAAGRRKGQGEAARGLQGSSTAFRSTPP